MLEGTNQDVMGRYWPRPPLIGPGSTSWDDEDDEIEKEYQQFQRSAMPTEMRQAWEEHREHSLKEYEKQWGGWKEWVPPVTMALQLAHAAKVGAKDPKHAWPRFWGQGRFSTEHRAREYFKRRHGRYPRYPRGAWP